MERSNLDVAFELVSKKKNPVEFLKLWEEVSSIQGLSKEEAIEEINNALGFSLIEIPECKIMKGYFE